MRISPVVTSSSPATMRSSVDLPQPDGPTSTRNSPSRTSSVTSLTACPSRPNDLPTPLRSTPGIAPPPAPAHEIHPDVAGEQQQRAEDEPAEPRAQRVLQRGGIREQP